MHYVLEKSQGLIIVAPKSTEPKMKLYLILFLMFQDGLQEGSALVAGRLLVEHTGLDHLLVHV